MGIKFFAIAILIVLLSTSFITSGEKNFTNISSLETREVKIAMLSQERTWDCRDLDFFKEMLVGYEWIVGNVEYVLNIDLINDDDILKGNLETTNYDMIIVSGGAIGDTEAFIRCFPTIRNYKWKKNIVDFIEAGGGYFSVCGGTALITDLDMDHLPRSFGEYAYEKSGFGVSCIKSHYTTSREPLVSQLAGYPPEEAGPLAYCLYTGWNLSDFDCNHRGGLCQDFNVNTSHPIFDDYQKNTRRLRWIGGPWLVVPEDPDREVSVLASHPEEEMSDNESTCMYAWSYTGRFFGMVKGLFRSIGDKENLEFTNPLMGMYTHAEDWEPTDIVIETDYSNKPAMTAEIYPNANEGRIVLCGPHIERNVWWGGHWEQVEDHDHNNLFEGFYHWKNITPNPLDYEWTYNFWLNRRCITWSAKVPDDDLPPVYGPSQVCDFESNKGSLNFKIYGNSETADGVVSLELYYRHSDDNLNWSDWTLFGIDNDESDGWSWDFNSPDGSGHYQFYSIRNVDYEGYIETEKVPPGPDAMVFVEDA